MDNFNLDQNTINNIKNMVDNGNISDAISQISPEMIQNFSKMLNNTQNSTQNNQYTQNSNNSNNNYSPNLNNQKNNFSNNTNTNNTSSTNNNFNLGNIDMNTLMKLQSIMGKMNNKNDPRSNLLNSLKPYLRNGRQDKVDQYVNLLNISKIADVLKTDKKENNNDV